MGSLMAFEKLPVHLSNVGRDSLSFQTKMSMKVQKEKRRELKKRHTLEFSGIKHFQIVFPTYTFRYSFERILSYPYFTANTFISILSSKYFHIDTF